MERTARIPLPITDVHALRVVLLPRELDSVDLLKQEVELLLLQLELYSFELSRHPAHVRVKSETASTDRPAVALVIMKEPFPNVIRQHTQVNEEDMVVHILKGKFALCTNYVVRDSHGEGHQVQLWSFATFLLSKLPWSLSASSRKLIVVSSKATCRVWTLRRRSQRYGLRIVILRYCDIISYIRCEE